MLLAYVDESYDRECHWVAAVVVHDAAVNAAHRALRQVVTDFAEHGIDDTAELHGHELFQGSGAFAALRPVPNVRIAMYRRALSCLVDCDARIIVRGVHRPNLHARYGGKKHPHLVAMTQLLERIDEYATDRGELALVVADEHHETQARMLSELRTYQETATWGYRARKLTRIVDTIHFVRSDTNMLVQAADLVAYLHRRREAGPERDPRAQASNTKLWSIVEPLVEHSWCWTP